MLWNFPRRSCYKSAKTIQSSPLPPLTIPFPYLKLETKVNNPHVCPWGHSPWKAAGKCLISSAEEHVPFADQLVLTNGKRELNTVFYVFRWQYKTEEELEGRSYWGRITTYSGGGFIRLLEATKDKTKAVIEDLKVSDDVKEVISKLIVIQCLILDSCFGGHLLA